MAKSLALWFDKKDDIKHDVELHVNFWSFDSEKINYLDIGVLIKSDYSDIRNESGSLNIYFPFEFEKKHYFSNLGSTICSDDELVPAIFNTNSSKIEKETDSDTYQIELTQKDTLKFHTAIGLKGSESSGNVELEKNSTGTILKFPIKTILSNDEELKKDYFRFRITLNDEAKNVLGSEHAPKTNLLTNNFNSIEIVDFRINEPRNLPSQIKKNLKDYSASLQLESIHFFLIRDANAELKMSQSPYKRCRILEKNIWEKYLQPGSSRDGAYQKVSNFLSLNSGMLKLPKQMLIYHWHEKKKEDQPSIEHFSAFAKFNQSKPGWVKIVAAILFVLLLSIFSGITSSYIYSVFGEKIWKSDSNCVKSDGIICPLNDKVVDSAKISKE